MSSRTLFDVITMNHSCTTDEVSDDEVSDVRTYVSNDVHLQAIAKTHD